MVLNKQSPLIPTKMQGRTTGSEKELLLLICCCLFMMLAHSGSMQPECVKVPIDPETDVLAYGGTTIRLLPTLDRYYSFDIAKAEKVMAKQSHGPLPGMGLISRKGALTTARWMVDQYQRTGDLPKDESTAPYQTSGNSTTT